MNDTVIDNFSKLKSSLFIVPLLLLVAIVVFLFSQHSLSVEGYIQVQKNLFYFINSKYSQFPTLIYNLTQLGDALIFFSFIGLLLIYVPKIWETLLTASIVSALLSAVLKNLFSVPRPAASFDTTTFTIIGNALSGHSSLPSGHSITVFTGLSIFMFAFMPKKINYKMLWSLGIVCLGILLVLTRVGVGAHYPLDTMIGGIIGYISALIGIFINRKYPIWSWINNKKYYPVFIALFLVCIGVLVNKILHENLIVFYLALLSLIVSLYKIIYVYIKK